MASAAVPPGQRASDADRERVAEVLREAAGEGRLDIAELEARLEQAYRAKTYGELAPITADLPGVTGLPRLAGAAAPEPARGSVTVGLPRGAAASVAVFGNVNRRGEWLVPPAYTAVGLFGSVSVDLRDATFSAPQTILHAYGVFGSVDVLVGEDVEVYLAGVPLFGEFTHGSRRRRRRRRETVGGPVLRVEGAAIFGSVRVRHKPGPAEPGDGGPR